jgi:hypothetical protein
MQVDDTFAPALPSCFEDLVSRMVRALVKRRLGGAFLLLTCSCFSGKVELQ